MASKAGFDRLHEAAGLAKNDIQHLLYVWLLPFAGTASFILGWEVFSTVIVDTYLLPPPSQIVTRGSEIFDLLMANLVVTLRASAIGFVACIVISIVSAVLITSDERLENAIYPLLAGMSTLPKVTVAPILIFYFGSFQAQYLLAAWIAFFPMLVNSVDGFSLEDRSEEALLDTWEATTWQRLRYIRYPAAIPYLFDGMKVAVKLAIVGAVTGEFIAANQGIGYLTLFALQELQVDVMIAAIGLLATASVVLIYLLFLAQDRLVHWRNTQLIPQ